MLLQSKGISATGCLCMHTTSYLQDHLAAYLEHHFVLAAQEAELPQCGELPGVQGTIDL